MNAWIGDRSSTGPGGGAGHTKRLLHGMRTGKGLAPVRLTSLRPATDVNCTRRRGSPAGSSTVGRAALPDKVGVDRVAARGRCWLLLRLRVVKRSQIPN